MVFINGAPVEITAGCGAVATGCSLSVDEETIWVEFAALAFRTNQMRVLTMGDKKAKTAKLYPHQGTEFSDRATGLICTDCF